MNNELNWDDLRFVLSIQRTGTLSGAGRDLRLSHATIFRRLGELESRMGVKLFERSRTGYSPTTAGEEIANSALQIEEIVINAQRQIQGRDLQPKGTIYLTTTDSLFTGVLSPIFASFQIEYPEIKLDVSLSSVLFNLSRRECDIAIRPTLDPPQHLIGRKTISIPQAVYAAKRDLKELKKISNLASMTWIAPEQSMMYRELDYWMEKQGLINSVALRVNSLLGMASAARARLGVCALPCYLGDSDSDLERLIDTIPELSTDLWLLTHSDLRKTTRIRIFMDYLSNHLKEISQKVVKTSALEK